ncbi:endonuclease [Planococcus salinus]|uniref:Endonuclease n=2 Tax=Planococcus salinus TaxID=1848460 RepID=A0A3M8P554_9BACL|nr:endonuclease [Planococcus salinus]
MSFNIAHGLGMDGVVDLEKTARVIEESEVEIIGLQEVDRFFSARSSFIDQVDWLSKRLGMYAAFGANLNVESEELERPIAQYGNAVLSKYPIRYAENHKLTQVIAPIGNNEPRGILETVVDIKGTYISFFNTHFSLKDEELKVSVLELLEISGKSRFPRIVTGDFNAPPRHEEMSRIKHHFQDAFLKVKKGDAYTYPSPYVNQDTREIFRPATRIDYVFTDDGFEVSQAEAIETAVSDHLPIIADLVLTKIPGRTKQPAKTQSIKL